MCAGSGCTVHSGCVDLTGSFTERDGEGKLNTERGQSLTGERVSQMGEIDMTTEHGEGTFITVCLRRGQSLLANVCLRQGQSLLTNVCLRRGSEHDVEPNLTALWQQALRRQRTGNGLPFWSFTLDIKRCE